MILKKKKVKQEVKIIYIFILINIFYWKGLQ
jgi:hypothetical protein